MVFKEIWSWILDPRHPRIRAKVTSDRRHACSAHVRRHLERQLPSPVRGQHGQEESDSGSSSEQSRPGQEQGQDGGRVEAEGAQHGARRQQQGFRNAPENGLQERCQKTIQPYYVSQHSGFSTGENLGKNGSEGAVQEPIPFEVKNNRSGLGREALLKVVESRNDDLVFLV